MNKRVQLTVLEIQVYVVFDICSAMCDVIDLSTEIADSELVSEVRSKVRSHKIQDKKRFICFDS